MNKICLQDVLLLLNPFVPAIVNSFIAMRIMVNNGCVWGMRSRALCFFSKPLGSVPRASFY